MIEVYSENIDVAANSAIPFNSVAATFNLADVSVTKVC